MKSLGILGLILIIAYFVIKYKEFSYKHQESLGEVEIEYRVVPHSVYDTLKTPNMKYKFSKLFENDGIEYNKTFYDEKNVNI